MPRGGVVDFVFLECIAVYPRISGVIRFRVISRKDVPVNVFHLVAVAGVVQLPRLKCCAKGLAGRHNLNKEIALSEIWQFVEFSDVLLEEDQRVTPVKLVIADDEDGVFELMDEIGAPSVYPQCDPVTNETGIGSLVHLSGATPALSRGALDRDCTDGSRALFSLQPRYVPRFARRPEQFGPTRATDRLQCPVRAQVRL